MSEPSFPFLSITTPGVMFNFIFWQQLSDLDENLTGGGGGDDN